MRLFAANDDDEASKNEQIASFSWKGAEPKTEKMVKIKDTITHEVGILYLPYTRSEVATSKRAIVEHRQ